MAVRVTDNGLPAKSHDGSVKISVVDPPPPPIAFDPARQSIVTGITEIGGKRLLWVTIRTEGRVLQLKEGDELAVGSVRGTSAALMPAMWKSRRTRGRRSASLWARASFRTNPARRQSVSRTNMSDRADLSDCLTSSHLRIGSSFSVVCVDFNAPLLVLAAACADWRGGNGDNAFSRRAAYAE